MAKQLPKGRPSDTDIAGISEQGVGQALRGISRYLTRTARIINIYHPSLGITEMPEYRAALDAIRNYRDAVMRKMRDAYSTEEDV